LVGGRVVIGALLGRSVDVVLERDQADEPGRRLDRDAHLVTVVGAAEVEAVRRRADGASKDQTA